ncbi:MAG: hypothetical protein J5982_05365 [Bacilli bacterium]|nr:hypothetical protein [Bacilli bacterium]
MNKKNRTILYYNLIFILIILIGISSFFLAYFYNLIDEDLRMQDVSVVENSEMNFSVKEKGKEVFTHNKDTYNLSDIDTINTYFNYSITFSEEVTGSYSYNIVGYREVNGEDVEIYKSNNYQYEVTGHIINLSSSFDIKDIPTNIVGASNLKYVVKINYSLFNDYLGRSFVKSDSLNITIPNMNETTIKTSDKVSNKKIVFSETKDDDNELYLVITLEFMGAIIMFILLILLILRTINKENDPYQMTIDHILKKYEKQIVKLKSIPDLAKMDVLFVSDFKDLVDASYNLDQVINYTEVIKNKASIFVVFNKHVAYVYKINRQHIK